MIIKKIYYTPKFIKEFRKLPRDIQLIAEKKEEFFKDNPLHPSLRLHGLKGKFKGVWSISINENYRLIFERMNNGDIIFHSIGKHDIYRSR